MDFATLTRVLVGDLPMPTAQAAQADPEPAEKPKKKRRSRALPRPDTRPARVLAVIDAAWEFGPVPLNALARTIHMSPEQLRRMLELDAAKVRVQLIKDGTVTNIERARRKTKGEGHEGQGH